MLEGDLVFVDKDCLEDMICELTHYHEIKELMNRKEVVDIDIGEIASMLSRQIIETYLHHREYIVLDSRQATYIWDLLKRYEELLKVGQRGTD